MFCVSTDFVYLLA